MDRTAGFHAGQIVIAAAGRETGTRFVVIGLDQNRLLLADGRKRSIGKPKRKNPCHIAISTGKELPAANLTDELIRKALREVEEEVWADGQARCDRG